MNEQKIRLNDIVSPQQIKHKRRGPIHLINNSLKRNTILTFGTFKRHHIPYQCKLPQVKLPRKDISHMLKYLFKKQQMNAADRNLIRRILVNSFDEDLISQSPDFVNHIEVLQGREGEIKYPEQPMFYMILKGSVLIETDNISYRRWEGQTFGELQIMSGVQIQQIVFTKNSLLLVMKEKDFQEYFSSRFNKVYMQRQSELWCLHSILNSIPSFAKYLFLSTYQSNVYQLGDKIIEKGQTFENMYIVGDKMKEERLKHLIKGCIGLHQLQLQKLSYSQTIYSPITQFKVPYFHKEDFQNYVFNFYHCTSFLKNSSIFEKSIIGKSTGSIQTNPQTVVKMGNFMKIKKVKLPCKRSKTQAASEISNNFRFLKDELLAGTKSVKKERESSSQPKKKNFSFCFKKIDKISVQK